ncbi:MAG: hypothetical protein PHF75_02285 [Gallionella sp.]|nr:hypothetical protein [Gallionella sp.]
MNGIERTVSANRPSGFARWMLAVALSGASLTAGAEVEGFHPVTLAVPAITFTGQVFQPVTLEVPAITFTGQVFQPVTLEVPAITFTGQVFQPVTLEVPAVTFTGQVFEPVTLAVPALTFTGNAINEVAVEVPGLSFTGRGFRPVSVDVTGFSMTGQGSTPAAVDRNEDNAAGQTWTFSLLRSIPRGTAMQTDNPFDFQALQTDIERAQGKLAAAPAAPLGPVTLTMLTAMPMDITLSGYLVIDGGGPNTLSLLPGPAAPPGALLGFMGGAQVFVNVLGGTTVVSSVPAATWPLATFWPGPASVILQKPGGGDYYKISFTYANPMLITALSGVRCGPLPSNCP